MIDSFLGFSTNVQTGCYHCAFSAEELEKCPGDFSYQALKNCVSEPTFQEKFEWKHCESYIFDRSIRDFNPPWSDQPWETAVTEFELVCEMYVVILKLNLIS